MVPPTSMWTGAVKREAAATHGIPGSLAAYEAEARSCVAGVGDEALNVGDAAGERLGDNILQLIRYF